jgi:hypothetical protein
MAYNTRFYARFKNLNGDEYTLYIKGNNYAGGSTEILKYALDPLEITYNGNDLDSKIAGSELKFNFYAIDPTDYYPLFESNYKDYKVELYKEASLYWVGWLKPENLSKQFIGSKYYIDLSAIDGIADLKDINYNLPSDLETRLPILQVIQNALQQTGINLNIEIQLNTYEADLMTSTQQALTKTDINIKRLIKSEKGILTGEKCYQVIEDLLNPFDCRLIQANGKYIITNYKEFSSFKHTYLYNSTIRQSRTAINNVIDITALKFYNKGDLTKIPPIKQVDNIYKNRNLGTTLISYNSSDWTVNNGGITEFTVDFNSSNIVFNLPEVYIFDPITTFIESDDIYVEKLNDDDYIKVAFDLEANHSGTSRRGAEYEFISVYGKSPDSDDFIKFDSIVVAEEKKEFIAKVPITLTGNYRVRIALEIISLLYYYDRTYTISNLSIADYHGSEDVTFDKLYRTELVSTSNLSTREIETVYGDGARLFDVGNFTINGELTGSWNRYTKTDENNIQFIKNENELENYQSFKDRLRIDFNDDSNYIHFNNIIQIDSKKYQITSYSYSITKGAVSAELVEILTASTLNYAYIITTNQVDGQSTSSSNIPISTSELSYSFVNGLGRSGQNVGLGGCLQSDRYIISDTDSYVLMSSNCANYWNWNASGITQSISSLSDKLTAIPSEDINCIPNKTATYWTRTQTLNIPQSICYAGEGVLNAYYNQCTDVLLLNYQHLDVDNSLVNYYQKKRIWCLGRLG